MTKIFRFQTEQARNAFLRVMESTSALDHVITIRGTVFPAEVMLHCVREEDMPILKQCSAEEFEAFDDIQMSAT